MKSQVKAEIEVNSHHVMHVALFLLRRIVDLHVDDVIPNANIVPWESLGPRVWEVDSYLRVGAVHLISSASSTLQSLVQLLGECLISVLVFMSAVVFWSNNVFAIFQIPDGISNIVINDDVGRAVNEAYNNIVLSKQHLNKNDLTNAVRYAKLAFAASEAAFFDPSLLALLYFPDDQKYVFVRFSFELINFTSFVLNIFRYAIYIPLFLPVLLPIILSSHSIIKHFRDISKAKTE